MRIFICIMLLHWASTGLCQTLEFKDITISNARIYVKPEGWNSSAVKGVDVFNVYRIGALKDSSKVILTTIARSYNSAGTRLVLSLDSLSRPIGQEGTTKFDKDSFGYKWNWGTNGRLLWTDEYINGKLHRRIVNE